MLTPAQLNAVIDIDLKRGGLDRARIAFDESIEAALFEHGVTYREAAQHAGLSVGALQRRYGSREERACPECGASERTGRHLADCSHG